MTNFVLVVFVQNIDMLTTTMERQGGEGPLPPPSEAAGHGEKEEEEEEDTLSDTAATSSHPVRDS